MDFPRPKCVKTLHIVQIERRLKDKKKMAQDLGIGEITLTDILKELEKPAREYSVSLLYSASFPASEPSFSLCLSPMPLFSGQLLHLPS